MVGGKDTYRGLITPSFEPPPPGSHCMLYTSFLFDWSCSFNHSGPLNLVILVHRPYQPCTRQLISSQVDIHRLSSLRRVGYLHVVYRPWGGLFLFSFFSLTVYLSFKITKPKTTTSNPILSNLCVFLHELVLFSLYLHLVSLAFGIILSIMSGLVFH